MKATLFPTRVMQYYLKAMGSQVLMIRHPILSTWGYWKLKTKASSNEFVGCTLKKICQISANAKQLILALTLVLSIGWLKSEETKYRKFNNSLI